MDDSVQDFKSKMREELKKKGQLLHGSCGDEWSDLKGDAVATKSFKLPNPFYYAALAS